MKDFFVVFTTNNAIVFKGTPEKLSDNILVNPDRSKVSGVPPHFWKKVGNEIHPMNEDEKLTRLAHIDKHGVDRVENTPYKPNVVTLYVNRFKYKPLTILNKISLFATGFLVSSLFWILLFKHK